MLAFALVSELSFENIYIWQIWKIFGTVSNGVASTVSKELLDIDKFLFILLYWDNC